MVALSVGQYTVKDYGITVDRAYCKANTVTLLFLFF
jgi:hypothetical protein